MTVDLQGPSFKLKIKENVMDALQPVLIIAVIFLGIIALLREVSQNRLRHKVVDKGVNPSNLNFQALFSREAARNRYGSLKWGMLLVGIGLVLLVVQILPVEVSDETTVGIMSLVAGLCLLIYHFAAPAVEKTEDKKTAR
jgi:hypothetical protein